MASLLLGLTSYPGFGFGFCYPFSFSYSYSIYTLPSGNFCKKMILIIQPTIIPANSKENFVLRFIVPSNKIAPITYRLDARDIICAFNEKTSSIPPYVFAQTHSIQVNKEN